MIHDPADNSLLPYDTDAYDPKAPRKAQPAILGDTAFSYIGQALTLPQFQAYVAAYDFGKVQPDYVVFHHTANPDASWAPIGNDPETKWDRHEAGKSVDEIRTKRQRQLDGIRNYYQGKGWSSGPHLFIDDRFIWLFTPMADVGIHAKWGNSFRAMQRLHYSIGIEVIGYYERVQWPPAVRALVGGAVRALAQRLGFALDYMYPHGSPGMKLVKGEQVCARPELLRFGGLSSHRDYNKPECPGSAITEAFYTSVCNAGATSPPPVSEDKFLLWGDIGKPEGVAQGWAIPKAWLVNKVLGRCVAAESYSASGAYSVAEFERGIVLYMKAKNTTQVVLF